MRVQTSGNHHNVFDESERRRNVRSISGLTRINVDFKD